MITNGSDSRIDMYIMKNQQIKLNLSQSAYLLCDGITLHVSLKGKGFSKLYSHRGSGS